MKRKIFYEYIPIEKNQSAINWLSQFEMGDRQLATQLLKSLELVSRDDFADGLRKLIIERANATLGPIALYAEREIRCRKKIPNRLFKESRGKRKRACGASGPLAVKPTKPYDPSVGSEGIVANLINGLCKEYSQIFLNHPGPEQIRRNKVRAFWIVTDQVGSGNRVRQYLEAAWLVRSVRSWWSSKLLNFSVLAYGSTDLGQEYVSSHPSKPSVFSVKPVPTIRTVFSDVEATKMERLCETYNPTPKDSSSYPWLSSSHPLGYGGTGALMIFAHGAPNNVPLIFHKASAKNKSRQKWVPLFPSRISAGIDSASYGVSLTTEQVHRRLTKLGEEGLTKSRVVNSDLPTREIFMLLTALSKPPRCKDLVLSRRSGLETTKVRHLCALMTEYGWLDSQRKLTDLGQGQLHHARKAIAHTCQEGQTLKVQINEIPYYPKSLRFPV